MEFLNSELFATIILPVTIFFLRLSDVAMATIRIIFISKGYKLFAALIGFFEIIIWVFAVAKIMENLDNWVCYIAYAGGFAAGNFIGMVIEDKLAIGHQLIRIITKMEAFELVDVLKEKGFGITTIKATGISGEVAVIYLIVNRKHIQDALATIKIHNPQALYTIEDIRNVHKEVYYGQVLPDKNSIHKRFFKK